ncbi:hypothetical protein N7453_002344 [Penicillium expansum]|nr:hypothetical protein N7453_002344 [Penicillium expansum]
MVKSSRSQSFDFPTLIACEVTVCYPFCYISSIQQKLRYHPQERPLSRYSLWSFASPSRFLFTITLNSKPILALTDEELEELTQVRVRRAQQARAQAILIQEAQEILDFHNFLETLSQYLLPPRYLQYGLLSDLLEQLRLQEEHDQAQFGMWED